MKHLKYHTETSTMNTPSFYHKNKAHHNWLIYHNTDFILTQLAQEGHINGTLYDLGCGEMPYRDWLLEFADNYTGVDWSDTLHKLKADIIADLNQSLPIKDEVANTVISLSVMEHLCEPQRFLNEAHRILKTEGTMVLQVPFMWWVHEAPHDYFRYTHYGLEYMFKKSGFTNITILPIAGFWSMWILKFNYQTVRLVRYSSSWPWPFHKLITLFMQGLWAIDQRVAFWLDKHWKAESETVGYFVVAKKS